MVGLPNIFASVCVTTINNEQRRAHESGRLPFQEEEVGDDEKEEEEEMEEEANVGERGRKRMVTRNLEVPRTGLVHGCLLQS